MTTASTGGPRWLTDEEQGVWQAYLHATTLMEDHLDRQLQRDAGMPHTYYGLLVQLSRAPGRQKRMTELAKDAKITRSRLSHAVARLEKNGWVRREDCPSDKRGQNAVRTGARRGGTAGDLRPAQPSAGEEPRRDHAGHRRRPSAGGHGRGSALAPL